MNKECMCKSCGMSIKKDSDFGTNADGSLNKEYCRHCYQKGVCLDDNKKKSSKGGCCGSCTSKK